MPYKVIIKKMACILSVAFLFCACTKDPDPDGPGDPDGSTMISKANGFEYIGSFDESGAPDYFVFPFAFNLDDYLDNDRVLVMCQNTIINPLMQPTLHPISSRYAQAFSMHDLPDHIGHAPSFRSKAHHLGNSRRCEI